MRTSETRRRQATTVTASLLGLFVVTAAACGGSDSGDGAMLDGSGDPSAGGSSAAAGSKASGGSGSTSTGGSAGAKATGGAAGSGTAGSPFGGGGSTAGAGAGAGPGGTSGGTGGSGVTDGCDPASGINVCQTCCESAHPTGAQTYSKDISTCACAGACKSQCAAACQSGQVDSACNGCLKQAFGGGQCKLSGCQGDADCVAYVNCAQACSTSGTGGSGGSGTGGSGTGGSGTAGSSSGDALEAARQACVDEINMYRATLGLPALKRWNTAETCSDGEAQSDASTGKAHGAFGKCGESAQNECPDWPPTPASQIKGCLKMMWDEGPGADFNTHGHYINMSSKSYTQVACSFFVKSNGSWWGVQNFK